jgi:predicted nuclease of predicted toxin-antitoxin system
MKFLIDMNLSPELARVLRSHGYESEHWMDIGPKNADDSIIFDWAREKGYTIITLDLDFGTLLARSHSRRPSVIQIRREDVNPIHLKASLIKILSEYSTAIEEGALIVLDEKKIRIRALPF